MNVEGFHDTTTGKRRWSVSQYEADNAILLMTKTAAALSLWLTAGAAVVSGDYERMNVPNTNHPESNRLP